MALLLVASLSQSEADLHPADATVPETDLIVRFDEAFVSEIATDEPSKVEGVRDDDEDKDVNRLNSVGANTLTGDGHKAASKLEADDDGEDPAADPGIERGSYKVKSPGYIEQDAYTSEDGHYYIGLSRRRIGAGFGRRRRSDPEANYTALAHEFKANSEHKTVAEIYGLPEGVAEKLGFTKKALAKKRADIENKAAHQEAEEKDVKQKLISDEKANKKAMAAQAAKEEAKSKADERNAKGEVATKEATAKALEKAAKSTDSSEDSKISEKSAKVDALLAASTIKEVEAKGASNKRIEESKAKVTAAKKAKAASEKSEELDAKKKKKEEAAAAASKAAELAKQDATIAKEQKAKGASPLDTDEVKGEVQAIKEAKAAAKKQSEELEAEKLKKKEAAAAASKDAELKKKASAVVNELKGEEASNTEAKVLNENVNAAKKAEATALKNSDELEATTKKKEEVAAADTKDAERKTRASAIATEEENTAGTTEEPPEPTTISDLCQTTAVENTKWNGEYNQYGKGHPMKFDFQFDPEDEETGIGNVQGTGTDQVGSFSWSGTYQSTHVTVTKAYLGKHSLLYIGELEPESGGVGFVGTWSIIGNTKYTGSFDMMETTRLLHLGCAIKAEEEYLPSKLCAVDTAEETTWTGYYVQKGIHHQMDFTFSLEPGGTIQGSGSDSVGSFEWSGTFLRNDINAVKTYVGKHSLTYVGQLSENEEEDNVQFAGTWTIISASGAQTSITGDFLLQETTHTLSLGCESGPPLRTPVPTPPCVVEETTSWNGFYEQSGVKHHMQFTFELEKQNGSTQFNSDSGIIHGKGSDSVGDFEWSGKFSGTEVDALKAYVGKHTVQYKGDFIYDDTDASKVTFKGIWSIVGYSQYTGPFTMVQDKRETGCHQEEDDELVLKL